MSVVLVCIGAGIFLLLGLAHTAFTVMSTPTGGPMMPTNVEVQQAMHVSGGLGLAPDINATLYRAWVGFNLSHSLGIIAVAGLILWHAVADLAAVAAEPWFLVLAILVPACYLVLAQLYWFNQPRDAIGFATFLLWAGMAVELI